MNMQLYTIMPLDTDHLQEICEDIRQQIETGVATCALFMFALVPEGNPPVNKVGRLCERFKKFQRRLKEMGLPCGVLVQCTIGHGWVLDEMFPFQPFTALDTGAVSQIVCPYDEGFRSYIRNCFREIAACRPDTIMLDDDFRLMSCRQGNGCGCPLHVKAFNYLAGTSLSREEIWESVHREGPEGDRANEIMEKVQRESLVECAKQMRAGIDEIDPSIPGSFCCVGNNTENAEEISHILAGKGNPSVVRINNGNYTPAGARFFSNVFLRAAQSVAKIDGKVDVILAETDTCPQNRYSTGAMSLHTHFTGSLLEGVNGAKHWITRLSSYEPKSGKAYREVLGRYRGFYQTIVDLLPHLSWRGFRIPTSRKACFDYRRKNSGFNGWSANVLERLGLPMYFSYKSGGITCFSDDTDQAFSDEEISECLKTSVFLTSAAAASLIRRGFGDKLGIAVRPWKGKQPSYEFLPQSGNRTNVQEDCQELLPLGDTVKEWSTVYHSLGENPPIRLFPGTVSFHNADGGTAFVFCGTVEFGFNIVEAFSFLNESRKKQLITMMQSVGELPVYYPGDAEIYLRAADIDDGRLFCSIFDLSLDPVENLSLATDRKVEKISRLLSDGTWQKVDFVQQQNILTLDLTCQVLTPEILILE